MLNTRQNNLRNNGHILSIEEEVTNPIDYEDYLYHQESKEGDYNDYFYDFQENLMQRSSDDFVKNLE